MSKRNASLRKLAATILATVVAVGTFSTSVFADTTLSNTELHAGASIFVNQVLTDQSTEDADMVAGAALYLQNEEEDLVADAEKEATLDVSGAAQALEFDPGVEEIYTIAMANVKDSVNVREDANEEAKTVGKLFTNCGGQIVEQKDGWTLLESGELKGWVKDDFLLFGEEADALSQEVGTYKATVLTDGLRVRKEANEEAGVYGVLAIDDVVTVKEQGDEWVTVQYDKDTVGYVSAEYVDVKFVVPQGKTNAQIEKEEKAKEEKKKAEEAAKAKKKEKSATSKKNRGAVAVGTSDVTLLAALIQCEAGKESYEGKLAVGAVVMNRVRSGSYPNSISAVITAPSQFPPATNGKVASVVAKGPSSACIQAAQEAINGASNVGGATHFKSAKSGGSGIVIGNHVFW